MERLKGIDISKCQGDIDFERVKGEGIGLVYIKTSEGSYFTDPFFEKNYEGASGENINVGFYHYLTARNASQARQEAFHFIKTIECKCFQGKPAVDFGDLTKLSRTEINLILMEFLKTVELYIREKPVIYSDVFDAANILENNLARYPLWIAEYDTSQPSLNNPWSTWSGWQYTDEGKISGINCNVNRNVFKEKMIRKTYGYVSAPRKPPREEESIKIYIVKRGDTLNEIAKLYNVSVESILRDNDVENPNLIYAGNVLNIRIPGRKKVEDIMKNIC